MRNKKCVLVGGEIVMPYRVVKRGAVFIENGTIQNVSDRLLDEGGDAWERIDCSGKKVMPGFIDVHTHGGAGFDFRDDSLEAIEKLSRYYYSHGVTSLLATLSPMSHDLLIPTVKRLVNYCIDNRDDTNIAGVHLEGPYINREMSGGNYKEYIEEPDFGRWREVFEAGNGLIRLMTVAPELHGIDGIIDDALKNGIVIALGHSLAGSEIAAAAIERGARQVTHIFNGMPTLHHREPGILAMALLSDKVDAEIIADGIHVHPRIIQLAMKAKTPDHLLVITDSMRAAGLADGEYESAGNTVEVVGGVSRLPDGKLAGSTLVFEKGFQLILSLIDGDLPAASRMTSLNAARSLGMDFQTGSIEVGKRADLVGTR